jgi:hypothetical protein
MGILIDPVGLEGWVWHAMFYQAMLEWQRGRHDSSLWWLTQRLIPHNEQYVNRQGEAISYIYTLRLAMARDLIGIVERHRELSRSGAPGDVGRFLDLAQQFTQLHETLDDGFVRREVENIRRRVLLALSGDNPDPKLLARESGEINDFFFCATTLMPNSHFPGWIWPGDSDLDLFYLAPPQTEEGAVTPLSRRVRFTLTNQTLPGVEPKRLHLRVVGEWMGEKVFHDDALIEPGNTHLFDKPVDASHYILLFITAVDGAPQPVGYELFLEP